MPSKRKRLSLKDKIDIIVESENSGTSARKLAKQFDIGKTQVTMILKNKLDLKRLFEEGFNPEMKRKFPKTEGFAIDQIVYNWVCQARSANHPISGPSIKQQALDVAEKLKVTNFKASNGWLRRFCQRHKIELKNMYCAYPGNVTLVDCKVVEDPSLGTEEIMSDSVYDNESVSNNELDIEECKLCVSSIKDMDEVCEKLRDIQNFLFCNDKSDLAVEISEILTKCETHLLKTEI